MQLEVFNNTTVGVLGFGNPAANLGLEAQKEDVGQTLGTYGIGGGCYFVFLFRSYHC